MGSLEPPLRESVFWSLTGVVEGNDTEGDDTANKHYYERQFGEYVKVWKKSLVTIITLCTVVSFPNMIYCTVYCLFKKMYSCLVCTIM